MPCFLFYRSPAWKHPCSPHLPSRLNTQTHTSINVHYHNIHADACMLGPWKGFPIPQVLFQSPLCLVAPVAPCANPYCNTDHTHNITSVFVHVTNPLPTTSQTVSTLNAGTLFCFHQQWKGLLLAHFGLTSYLHRWPINICGLNKLTPSTLFQEFIKGKHSVDRQS